MPNEYLPNLIQIRPQYSPSPDTAEVPQNVLWFRSASAGTPSQANLTSIANAFDAVWNTLFAAYGCSTAHYTGNVTTDWGSATGGEWSTVGAYTPVAGTSGNPLPENVAILVSYQIGLRWRGGHFRTYLPYVGSGSVQTADGNKVVAAVQSSIATHLQSVIANMEGTGVLGGQTIQAFKNKTGKKGTPTLYPISSFIVQPVVASQRRRLRKVTRK